MDGRNYRRQRPTFSNTRLLIFVLALLAVPRYSGAHEILEIGAFSSAPEGSRLPQGWKPLTFPKIPKHTEYALVKDGDTTVVQARSQDAASGLVRKIQVDLKEYPILHWRWKITNLIAKSDVHSKAGDDFPARLYITFAYNPDRMPFWKKTKYRAARFIFGDVPADAITYIWENTLPKGTITDNPYTEFAKMIVVESGPADVGRWVEEERNVYEDYKKAFGEEPPLINGVAIMTDTDNTRESATAYYGDIVFKKE